MENQLSSLVLFCFVLSLSIFEIRRFKNLITPFTVVGFPIVFISLIINFLFIHIDVYPVTMRVNLFLLLNLIIFWTAGFFLYSHNGIKISTKNHFIIFNEFESYKIIFVFAAILTSIIMFWRISVLVQSHGGWFYLGNQEFEKDITSGPVAHIMVLGMAIFIILYMISAKSKYKILTYPALTILGLSFIFLMVKYYLFWLIMMVFFINNLNLPIRKQIKGILKIFLILLILFIIYFIILTIFWQTFSVSNESMWLFYYRMVLNYMISSPLVLEYWLDTPGVKPDWALIVVFKNFFNLIIGNPVRYNIVPLVSNGFEKVGPSLTSNVGTSFGVFYLFGGLPLTILLNIVISVISYLIYIKARITDNPIILFLLIYTLTINTLTFFGQYITAIPFYEFPIFLIIIICILKYFNKIKLKINIK